MRAIGATELGVLLAARRHVYARCEVLDPDGVTWRDVSLLDGGGGTVDFFDRVAWGTDLDASVWSGTITLRRDAYDGTGNLLSVNPFVAASLLNQSGAGYAPLLDLGRRVRLSTAVVAPGASPVGSPYWHRVFDGVIDDVDPQSAAGQVTLQVRDLGAFLVDAQIRTPAVYGSEGGTLLEDVVESILDATVIGGPIPTLTVQPASPGWALKPFNQQPGALQPALDALAIQIGWRVRYRWHPDGSDTFRLTLYEPERDKTTPDLTLTSDQYGTPTALHVSLANVRNVVEVRYFDSASRSWQSETREVADSVAAYGPRFMRLKEDAASNIDTAAEAWAMAEAAALDLALPKADLSLPCPYLWMVEPGDLLGVGPGSAFDEPQTFGVVGVQHEITGASASTTLTLRGAVAGAYRAWILKGGGGVRVARPAPMPTILGPWGEASAYGDDPAELGSQWYAITFDRQTQRIVAFSEEAAEFPAPPPNVLQPNNQAADLVRLPGKRPGADAWRVLYRMETPAGVAKTAIFWGLDAEGRPGPRTTLRGVAVDPPGGIDPGDYSGITVDRAYDANTLHITRGSAGSSPHDIVTVVRRNDTIVDYFPASAAGVTVDWVDDGMEPGDAAGASYEVFAWSYGVSGARRRATTATDTPDTPPAVPPPTHITPDPVDFPPESGLPSAWDEPPHYIAATAGVAARVAFAWSSADPSAGYVRVEKSAGYAGTGYAAVTSGGATGAGTDPTYYQSGTYRLVTYTADPGSGGTYLATSEPFYYVAPTSTVGRTSPGSGGGGGTGGGIQGAV